MTSYEENKIRAIIKKIESCGYEICSPTNPATLSKLEEVFFNDFERYLEYVFWEKTIKAGNDIQDWYSIILSFHRCNGEIKKGLFFVQCEFGSLIDMPEALPHDIKDIYFLYAFDLHDFFVYFIEKNNDDLIKLAKKQDKIE